MLKIRLLGQFSLVYGDEQITSISADRLQSLFVYLLLHRQSPQPRHHIAFQLWPDSSETQARSNLRNLLFSLRQALPDAEQFLEITNLTLAWRSDAPYWLDVAEFQELLAQAGEARQIRAVAEAQRALERAAELYEGELLPGNYDDWIFVLREDLRHAYQDALIHLITLLEESGDSRAAIRYAQRLLQQDPLDEGAYVHLMRLHASNGDRAGVRRIYENCVNMLLRELDVDPSETTVAAYEQYLRMSVPFEPVMLPSPVQAAASASPLPAVLPPVAAKRLPKLPAPAVPFVGREQELAELAQLLAEPGCRLLTILGPGGIGKTHLAIQTAKGHQPVFADGVLFVPLASVPSSDQLVFTLLNTLDLPITGTADPVMRLLDYLREKELLLVLDNFEHVLDGVDLLLEILAQTGAVKILVTSRERLNLQEEWVYSLHGLPLPEEDDPDWQENSSVALFLQTARKTRSNFTLSDVERPAMMQICRLLGGMPLGLQLAASWVRVLSPAEIAHEIEQNLEFLTVSHRNVPERHRSLRAVFDHSWQLLSPAEQALFSKLSVFQGSFSREAAESVAGANLLALTSLVDKSLVRPYSGGRYSLLNLLRQYAALKVSALAEERCALQQQHSRYYMDFLHAQEGRLYSPAQIGILDAIGTELDNVQAAWQWAVDEGDEEGLRRGLHTLTFFYFRRSRYREAVPLIDHAIGRQRMRPQSATSQALLGRLLGRQGNFLHRLGRYEEAAAAFEESLSLLRTYEETPLELALALRSFGHLLDDTGDQGRAGELLEEALAIARQEAGTFSVAVTLSYLCSHHWRLNHFDQARVYIEESITLYRQIGDIWGLAHALTNLANSYRTPAEYHLAIDIFHESLALYRSLNNPAGTAQTLNSLGYTYMVLGEYEQAGEVFAESLKIQRQLGGSLSIARVLNNQGQIAYLCGEYEKALALSRESLAIRRAGGAAREVAFSLYTIGLILMDQGDVDSAASHWREALALFEGLGQPQKVANCLNELGNVAIHRGEWAVAADLLSRGLAIAQEVNAPWTEARARLFLGLLAHARGDTHGAVASLLAGLQIAIAAEEVVLALDILLEMAAVDSTPELAPWLVKALCLMQYHPQCRPKTRQRARSLLVAHGHNRDADCGAVPQGELSTCLGEIVASATLAGPVVA